MSSAVSCLRRQPRLPNGKVDLRGLEEAAARRLAEQGQESSSGPMPRSPVKGREASSEIRRVCLGDSGKHYGSKEIGAS